MSETPKLPRGENAPDSGATVRIGPFSPEAIAGFIAAGHEANDYRPVVVAVIRNYTGRVLLAQSAKALQRDNVVEWGFPQGGIDEGESVQEACQREVHEELGIDSVYLAVGEVEEITDIKARRGGPDKRGFSGGKRYFVVDALYEGEGELELKRDEICKVAWSDQEEALALVSDKRSAKLDLIRRALARK